MQFNRTFLGTGQFYLSTPGWGGFSGHENFGGNLPGHEFFWGISTAYDFLGAVYRATWNIIGYFTG